MQAAVVAGGWATRLGPQMANVASALVPVAGRPFLDYLLPHLVREGFDDVILLVDRHAEQVEAHVGNGERYHVRVRTYRDGERPLDVLGAVKDVEDILAPTFWLVRGNALPRIDFRAVEAALLARGQFALMGVHANRDPRLQNDVDVRGDLVSRFDTITPGPEHVHRFIGATYLRSLLIDEMRPSVPIGEQAFYGGLASDARLGAYVADTPSYSIATPEGLAHFTDAVARGEVTA